MKISHPVSSNRLLPADFAPRVVQRVSQIKHRRRLRRRALAVTTVLALGAGAFLAQRHESFPPYQPAVALLSPAGGDSTAARSANDEPVAHQEQPQPAINLFLPDAYMMTNFEDSNGESSWHTYDSWWSSNS